MSATMNGMPVYELQGEADETMEIMKEISASKSYGGRQSVYTHASSQTGTDMTFSAFVPMHRIGEKLPVVWYLSGLTCSHANVTEKGEYREACARDGLIFVAPDTSPRGDDVPGDPDGTYYFGHGAGFYVDATEAPFAQHYRMRSYIEDELPKLVADNLPADMTRQAVMGHSMGGHGALTIGLRNTDRFRSISAFAPIASPMNSPWGRNALARYLGKDEQAWREYDACALIADGAEQMNILVDQGTADEARDEQLKPHLLQKACEDAGYDADIRMQDGYDHSYYFVSTFMAEHLAWHANHLK